MVALKSSISLGVSPSWNRFSARVNGDSGGKGIEYQSSSNIGVGWRELTLQSLMNADVGLLVIVVMLPTGMQDRVPRHASTVILLFKRGSDWAEPT